MNYHYSIVIEWSDEDHCFVVSLPEWGEFCHTHGNTYEEALKNAQEVLTLLIESALEENESLPEPKEVYYPFQKTRKRKTKRPKSLHQRQSVRVI